MQKTIMTLCKTRQLIRKRSGSCLQFSLLWEDNKGERGCCAFYPIDI
jgi:hypothetical protein